MKKTKIKARLLGYCPVVENFGNKNAESCGSTGTPSDPFKCDEHGYFRQGDGFIVKVESKDFPNIYPSV